MNHIPSRADQAQGGGGHIRRAGSISLEPGWRVGQKLGNDREFCYMMAPGQDYYHRVYDGEIVVLRGDERLCLACAERAGAYSRSPPRAWAINRASSHSPSKSRPPRSSWSRRKISTDSHDNPLLARPNANPLPERHPLAPRRPTRLRQPGSASRNAPS